jgi:hypothetical protein
MPKEVSKWQLTAGYWLLTHRRQVKRSGLIIFILLDAVLAGLFLYNLVTYLVFWPAQNKMIASMGENTIDYQLLHQKSAPVNLNISQEEVLLNSAGQYDFLAKIKNPNSRWIISSFQYRFSVNGQKTDWTTSYLANNEEKYLFFRGYQYQGSSLIGENVSVEINDIQYRRIIHPDRVPQVNFTVANAQYSTIYTAGSEERYSQIKADITNKSVYSFWTVGCQIVLYSYDNPVAVNYTTISDFDTLQTKTLDLKWKGTVGGVTEVRIIPEINLIDDDNYKQYNIEL